VEKKVKLTEMMLVMMREMKQKDKKKKIPKIDNE
jgi:hypothetical protein